LTLYPSIFNFSLAFLSLNQGKKIKVKAKVARGPAVQLDLKVDFLRLNQGVAPLHLAPLRFT